MIFSVVFCFSTARLGAANFLGLMRSLGKAGSGFSLSGVISRETTSSGPDLSEAETAMEIPPLLVLVKSASLALSLEEVACKVLGLLLPLLPVRLLPALLLPFPCARVRVLFLERSLPLVFFFFAKKGEKSGLGKELTSGRLKSLRRRF